MRVGAISSASSLYVPVQRRIENHLSSAVSKAKAAGKSEVSVLLRDTPATHKALESFSKATNSSFSIERSDSMKATFKF